MHRSASPRPGLTTGRSGSVALGSPRLGARDRAVAQLQGDESPALSFLARRGSEAQNQNSDDSDDSFDREVAMANAERELKADAEWKRIQQNTFTRWANEHLKQCDKVIQDLGTDLSDGLKLIALVEVLSGKKMPRHNKKPNFRSQKLENVSIALEFLEREGITLVNIDSTDIVDCKLKLILGLIWTLILHYAISMPMWDGPPLGGGQAEKTPKQRLADWVKDKVPGTTNFTSDWNDGKKIGQLVDGVAPGLCPDWEDWDPSKPVENAKEAMDMADKWLKVPQLLTPEEFVDPNVDEQSMLTYLSQFPNAKLQPGAPLRKKALPDKVRAFGPGLEPKGLVAKAPANFTVETFGAGDGELAVKVIQVETKKELECEIVFNNDRKATYSCSYFPEEEGDYVVDITWSNRQIPNSPYNVNVEGFAGDASKVSASGPGLEAEGVIINRPTYFDIFAKGAGKGSPEVIILDPKGKKDSVPNRITPHESEPDTYKCEYAATMVGLHSVNVFFAGNPIPHSPFGVRVSPASIPSKVWASGRGLQPSGIRVNETVDFKVYTEGAGEGKVGVKIIGPGGIDLDYISRSMDPTTTEFTYTPKRDGRHIIMITFANVEIPRSPFEVTIGKHKTSKIKAYGPGLKGGIVNKPAKFTVDTCGETGALGFSIQGPSQAKINCKDNGDGSADVEYIPTVEGEYAVHILCDKEDIPGSPYMAQILPSTDYDPDKVKVFGPGIENGVNPKVETNFTVDISDAGDAPLEIFLVDDLGQFEPRIKPNSEKTVFECFYTPRAKQHKQTVFVNFGGVAVPGSPFRVVNDNLNDPALVEVYGPGIEPGVRVGAPTEFTVDCSKSGPGDVTVNITSAKRKTVPVSINDNGDDTYTVTYEAQVVGPQTIVINLDDNEVPQSPIKLDVKPAADLSKVSLIDFEPEAFVDCPNDFIVDTADLPANSKAQLECDITGPDGNPVEADVSKMGPDGPFQVSYIPTEEGDHEVDLRYDGTPLPDSPYPVAAIRGCNPQKVKAYGDGLEKGIVDEINTFTIETRNAGTGGLGIAVEGPSEAEMNCEDNKDGTCTVDYVPVEEGDYDIAIKFDDEHIPGSPFQVPVTTKDGKPKVDPSKVRAYGPGLEPENIFPGKPTSFVVDASGTGDAPLEVIIGDDNDDYNDDDLDDGLVSRKASGVSSSRKGSRLDNAGGSRKGSALDNGRSGSGSRKGSSALDDDGSRKGSSLLDNDGSRKGSSSRGKLNRSGSVIDEDEDGFGIDIGKKEGKGLAALKARGESLSRKNTEQDLISDNLDKDAGSRLQDTADILGDHLRKRSRKNTFSQPVISDKGDGTHEVSYVPPPVGDPYEIAVRYAGVDIPGSPFLMTCNPNIDEVVNAAISDGPGSRKGSALTPAEELSYSKHGTGLQRGSIAEDVKGPRGISDMIRKDSKDNLSDDDDVFNSRRGSGSDGKYNRSGTDAGRKGSGGSLGDSSGSRKSSSSSSGAAGSRKNSDDTPYHGRNLGSRKGSRELLQDGGTDRKSSRDNLDDNLSGRKGSGANAGRKGSQDSSRKGSRGSGNFDQDDLNDPSRKGSRDHRKGSHDQLDHDEDGKGGRKGSSDRRSGDYDNDGSRRKGSADTDGRRSRLGTDNDNELGPDGRKRSSGSTDGKRRSYGEDGDLGRKDSQDRLASKGSRDNLDDESNRKTSRDLRGLDPSDPNYGMGSGYDPTGRKISGFDPNDPNSRKESAFDPNDPNARKGSGFDPNDPNARRGSGYDPKDPNSRKGSGNDPNDPNARRGSGFDPNNPNSRKGSGFDPNDPNSRKGSGYDPNDPHSRKGSGLDPNNPNSRKGSGFDPNDPNSRKGSGYDPNDPHSRKGSGLDPNGRKGSGFDPNDPNSRKGSGFDPNDPSARRGSGFDPNDPNSRKGSGFDPNDPNARRGSEFDPNDPNARKGSRYDPNDPSRKGSRFGSGFDPNDPNSRKGPGYDPYDPNSRLGDAYDPNDPNSRKGSNYEPYSRKGSKFDDPSYRKGSEFDPKDPSYRRGSGYDTNDPYSRRGSNLDPNDPNYRRGGSDYDPDDPIHRRGSAFDPNDPYSRRSSNLDPNDPNYRRGSAYDPNDPYSRRGLDDNDPSYRRGSRFDPNDPDSRKRSAYDPNDRNFRRGSGYDPNDPYSRRGSNLDPSDANYRRQGSRYDPDDPNYRKGSHNDPHTKKSSNLDPSDPNFGSPDPNDLYTRKNSSLDPDDIRRGSGYIPNDPNYRKGSANDPNDPNYPSGPRLDPHDPNYRKGSAYDLSNPNDPNNSFARKGSCLDPNDPNYRKGSVYDSNDPNYRKGSAFDPNDSNNRNLNARKGSDFDPNDPNYNKGSPYDLNDSNSRKGSTYDFNDPNNRSGYDPNNPYARKGSSLDPNDPNYRKGSANDPNDSNNLRGSGYDPKDPYSRKGSNLGPNVPNYRKGSSGFDPTDPSGRKGSGFDPNDPSGRKGSGFDPNDPSGRKGSGFDPNDPSGKKGSGFDPNDPSGRKGSGFDPNEPSGRKGSGYDPNDPNFQKGSASDPSDPVSRKGSRFGPTSEQEGSGFDPNDPNNRRDSEFDPASRKGSAYDPLSRDGPDTRKGSRYDPNDPNSRKMSGYDPNDGEDPLRKRTYDIHRAGRKGSSDDLLGDVGPNSRKGSSDDLLGKKSSGYDPNDPSGRKGSNDDLLGSRKGSGYDPNDPSGRKGSNDDLLGSRKGSGYDPNDPHGRKGSGADSDGRKGSGFDPNDPYGRKGSGGSLSDSRKGSAYDPNDPYGRKGSGADFDGRKGSAYDANDPYGRKGSGANADGRKGSDFDPNDASRRKGSGFDANDPSGRKGSGYDPNDPYGRKGSSGFDANDPSGRKGSGFDPNDPSGRKGSRFDPNDPSGRKGSGYDPNDTHGRKGSSGFDPNDPSGRKGSGFDPNDPSGRKGSGYDPNDPYGRKGSAGFDPNDPSGRKGSGFDPNDPSGRKGSGYDPNDTHGRKGSSGFDPNDPSGRKGSGFDPNDPSGRKGSGYDPNDPYGRKGSSRFDPNDPSGRKGSGFEPNDPSGYDPNDPSGRKGSGALSDGRKGSGYDPYGRKGSGYDPNDPYGRKGSNDNRKGSSDPYGRKGSNDSQGSRKGTRGLSSFDDDALGTSGKDNQDGRQRKGGRRGHGGRGLGSSSDDSSDNESGRKGSKNSGNLRGKGSNDKSRKGSSDLYDPYSSRKGSGSNLNSSRKGSDMNGNQRYGGDFPFHPVELNDIPLPSTGGEVTAQVKTPSNAMHLPHVEDNGNGKVGVFYQPTEAGPHSLDVRYNGEHVQGSPYQFFASPNDEGKVYAYGPGLIHGLCGDSANFVISTKGAGAGGLALAVEGPSKADINCIDNKDGTVNVSYLPTAPGEYKVSARFGGEHIEGSPFTCKVTGEGKKRNAISVGSASEVSLPENISDYDLRSLNAYIVSPSGCEEPCFLKKLPKGNTGISFTPREVGEHLVSVKRSGKHITNSPFKIMVNPDDVGDASRVSVSGPALKEGKTHSDNMFTVDTKNAGYGGLSLSVEGPSKAEIKCKDNEDGTLDVSYKPSEPGLYIVNLKFADQHAPGSPFAVAVSGEGTERQTEKINTMREAVPVTEVGSQCRLTFKMPGIKATDLKATVASPTGKVETAMVVELEDGLFAVNFVPYELGVHTVSVMYRDVDIPGSPFQFTVGPLQDGGAHRVHAGGPGLERGVQGQPADFNVWTREAGHGSLAIAVEGPSKAEVEFKDRKDGSCHVSYVVEEPGEYTVGIRFNDTHIPGSPYKVYILPSADDAERVRMSNLAENPVTLDIPQTMLLNMNGAEGDVECKIITPSGREDDCFITPLGEGEHTVRFVPKEEGTHYLHARLNGIHIPGSPFKLEVQGNNNNNLSDDPSSVSVRGLGVTGGNTGRPSKFIIDTSGVGAGTLSITVDGPSKVDLSCNEVDDGYEVSYTPMTPGKYYVTVKYNGKNVRGSPFNVVVNGDNLSSSSSTVNNNRAINLQKEQSRSSMTMETMQRTSYIRHQYSEQRVSSMSMSRAGTRNQILPPPPPPKEVEPDPTKVKAKGKGLDHALISRQNSFTVDCGRAGNNVLYVGVYGPDIPCDEVVIKHVGEKKYSVSYVVHQKGEYMIFVKWGDDHIPGSPFRVVA